MARSPKHCVKLGRALVTLPRTIVLHKGSFVFFIRFSDARGLMNRSPDHCVTVGGHYWPLPDSSVLGACQGGFFGFPPRSSGIFPGWGAGSLPKQSGCTFVPRASFQVQKARPVSFSHSGHGTLIFPWSRRTAPVHSGIGGSFQNSSV